MRGRQHNVLRQHDAGAAPLRAAHNHCVALNRAVGEIGADQRVGAISVEEARSEKNARYGKDRSVHQRDPASTSSIQHPLRARLSSEKVGTSISNCSPLR
jgi:hypothetical protein